MLDPLQMPNVSRRAALIAFLVLSSSLSQAAAQEAEPAEDREYWTLIQAAIEEHESGAYEEARALYRRAHALQPNARTLLALGMVSYELHVYPAAVRYLRDALTEERQALDDTMRAEAQRLLPLAEARTGRFRIVMRPPSATLTIDGEAPTLEPDGSVLLGIGEHRIEATAPEHEPAHRDLEVRGGEERDVQLSLTPVPGATPAPAAALVVGDEEPAPAGEDIASAWWLWTIVGVVVATGVAIALGVALYDPGTVAPYPGTTGVIQTLWELP